MCDGNGTRTSKDSGNGVESYRNIQTSSGLDSVLRVIPTATREESAASTTSVIERAWTSWNSHGSECGVVTGVPVALVRI
jgi:hypothetical protein